MRKDKDMEPIEPGRKVTTDENDPNAVNVSGVPGADDVTVHVDNSDDSDSLSVNEVEGLEETLNQEQDVPGNTGEVDMGNLSEDDLLDDSFVPSSDENAEFAAGGIVRDYHEEENKETMLLTGNIVGDIITLSLGLLLGFVAFKFAAGYGLIAQIIAVIFVIFITIAIAYGLNTTSRAISHL